MTMRKIKDLLIQLKGYNGYMVSSTSYLIYSIFFIA